MILLLFSFCSTSITMLYTVNLWDFLIYSNKEEKRSLSSVTPQFSSLVLIVPVGYVR